MGLREDIPAKSVGLERAQKPPETAKEPSDSTVSGIKISHPDRLIWPSLGITKRELARYCEAVGEWLGATLPDAKHPDRITIDLDPDPELSWKKLVEATKLTRTLIEGLKLKCFLKTTGGKGLHVVFPLQRRHTCRLLGMNWTTRISAAPSP